MRDIVSATRVGIHIRHHYRSLPDEDKFRVYVRIVRLLLEEEDSVEAERYYNRAALLAHNATDKVTLLQFKLCQARISDYGRKFLEAAGRYHELSWEAEIDEDERKHMLYVPGLPVRHHCSVADPRLSYAVLPQ